MNKIEEALCNEESLRTITWFSEVKKHASQNPNETTMSCPSCDEEMYYNVSSYNGHVSAECKNCKRMVME